MASDNLLLDTLRKAEEFLGQKGIASPRLEAQLIFAHILGLKRIELFSQSDRPLIGTELDKLRQALRDKITGMPTAYVLGEREFYGRAFVVDKNVLIPRPETEELVEHVLKEIRQAEHVVDLGTGSGCIGITLAAELQTPQLTLVDISGAALAIARQNAGRLLTGGSTQINTSEADFTQASLQFATKAGLVVSNPPYVLPEEYAGLDSNVRDFEPKLALVPENFEHLHRRLLAVAHANLSPGGLFALETHPQKTGEVAAWATGQGFVRVEIRNDLAARPHFILAWV